MNSIIALITRCLWLLSSVGDLQGLVPLQITGLRFQVTSVAAGCSRPDPLLALSRSTMVPAGFL